VPPRSENLLQIRGPGYKDTHKSQYGPMAKSCGMHLSYKAWKDCMAEGLLQLAESLPGCDAGALRCGRAARHSKFPECSSCARLRKAYLSACQNCRTDPDAVGEAYDELQKHVASWSEDRRIALATRMSCFHTDAGAVYECDDK
jgi:hypothetical protein